MDRTIQDQGVEFILKMFLALFNVERKSCRTRREKLNFIFRLSAQTEIYLRVVQSTDTSADAPAVLTAAYKSVREERFTRAKLESFQLTDFNELAHYYVSFARIASRIEMGAGAY